MHVYSPQLQSSTPDAVYLKKLGGIYLKTKSISIHNDPTSVCVCLPYKYTKPLSLCYNNNAYTSPFIPDMAFAHCTSRLKCVFSASTHAPDACTLPFRQLNAYILYMLHYTNSFYILAKKIASLKKDLICINYYTYYRNIIVEDQIIFT